MELYPAIDVRAGRCVRLRQGDYADQTVYSDDPVAVARAFAGAGARWIHVVDLDAARQGEAANRHVVIEIALAVAGEASVQAGGGVRSMDDAAALLDHGVARVVLGTAAAERPALVRQAAERWPGRVAVGLDHRDGEVLVQGWQQGTGVALTDAVPSAEANGAAAIIVTDIAVDGMLAGPPLGQLRAVLAATGLPVIASGGVAALDDLSALAGLRVDGRSLAGVIVGKALYEGRFSVSEALAACRAGVAP
jgi:phosphoribosylformimino-5-aminoimidazole carboxamide ribotide isomerase